MDDRELLNLAAKAAGIQLNNAAMQTMYIGDDGQWVFWNPLLDDGDALRLAVTLGLTLGIEYGRKYAHASGLMEKAIDGDLHAAMRRAIVRAAADIERGKAIS